MKKLLFIPLLFFCTTLHAYDFTIDSLYYTILDSELYEHDFPIVEVSTRDERGIAHGFINNIPDTVRWNDTLYYIIGIGQYGFSGSKKSEIKFPKYLEYIGDYAFAFSNITSVTIPENVYEIGNGIFWECEELTSATWNAKSTKIPDNTFEGCKELKEINIPEGVVSIGTSAFAGCIKLEQVKLPQSIVSLGTACFIGCI